MSGLDELGPRLSGSTSVMCPYCGATVELIFDPLGGSHQEYVEDCEVCCRPWAVTVSGAGAGASVRVERLDG